MNDYKEKIEKLKWLKSIGIDFYLSNSIIEQTEDFLTKIKNENELSEIQQVPNKIQTPNILTKTTDTGQVARARMLASKAKNLQELKAILEDFDGCELKQFAKNTVFADGISSSKVMLIGEAPGASEDEQGIPFCGQSGLLLDKMIESIDLSRTKNAYITNTVFWRPPANRRPTQEEIDICRPFVEKHIALVNPSLIILVGATAATSLLGKHDGISNIRKNAYQYQNEYMEKSVKMMSIFHPAYLLRQPMQKKTTWFDLIGIKSYLRENKIIT